MAVFLEKNKVQGAGRLSLGPAALRNLGITEGDFVEIYFDESTGVLIIKRPEHDDSSVTNLPKKFRGKNDPV